jgi:hypothetical protein
VFACACAGGRRAGADSYPSLAASTIAVLFNVALGLVFVLGIPFNPNPNFNNATLPANSTLTGGFGA